MNSDNTHDVDFDEMDMRLRRIDDILHDPYKSIECKYSLVEDIVSGRY